MWGGKDIAFREQERSRFEAAFPDHTTVPLHEAGHHVQDDAPAEVLAAMRSFLA